MTADGPSGLRPDRIRLFVGADVSQKAELYRSVYIWPAILRPVGYVESRRI